MKNKNQPMYELSIQDIQTVARQELGRALVQSELKIIEQHVADRIQWYDIIATLIDEKIANT